MQIADLKIEDKGMSVELPVLLTESTLLDKKNGGKYLQVTVMDATGAISSPIWVNAETKYCEYEVNKVYLCFAEVGEYEGKAQLAKIRLEELSEDEYDINDLIATYSISNEMMEYWKKSIEDLPKEYSDLVSGCLDIVGLDNFMIAPAAHKHHHNKLAGLFYHTCGMLKIADMLEPLYKENPDINFNRLRTKIHLHDIGKTDEYTYPMIAYNTECIVDHLIIGAQLVKAVNLQKKLLSRKEEDNIAYGILAHHGQYGAYKPKTTEDELLHMIDMLDSRLVDQSEIASTKITKEPSSIDALIKKLVTSSLE